MLVSLPLYMFNFFLKKKKREKRGLIDKLDLFEQDNGMGNVKK